MTAPGVGLVTDGLGVDGAAEADLSFVVRSGVGDHEIEIWQWVESHMDGFPQPGPHLAINGVPQTGGRRTSIVVAGSQVPALIEVLHAAAASLEQTFEHWLRSTRDESTGPAGRT